MSQAIIRQFEVGPMENFAYLLGDAKSRQALVVDPAWEIDTLFKRAEEADLEIVGALVSHHHYDHTNGIGELLERKEMPVYVNKKDLPFIKFAPASSLTGVDHGTKIKVGDTEIELLHTPGHTPGSQCFKIQRGLVSGDTLFINGCGRCDLPGGDAEEMYYTLTQKLMRLPDDTVLYPGHNYAASPTSSLGEQKQSNPYLRLASQSLKDFLKLRMGR